MASRYGGITGSKRISEDFQNINTAFENVQSEMDANKTVVDTHLTSKTAHKAENITYTGEASGANVKQAIDGLDTRIDNLILAPGDSGPEVEDARGGFPVLGARLDSIDSEIEKGVKKGESNVNAKYPPAPLLGIKGDLTTDDSTTLQSVIDFAADNGGGIVLVPPGLYLLKSQVIVRKNVVLQGVGSRCAPQWETDHWNTDDHGTVFAVDFGAGSELITQSCIRLESCSKIIGCNFWYPNQTGSTTTPTPFPPTISHVDSDPNEAGGRVVKTDVIGCNFVNPWVAMNFTLPHELLNITDCRYYAWHKGIVLDSSLDIDRIVDVHFNPNIMYRGDWPQNNVYEYTLINFSVGIEIGQCDQIYLTRVFGYGFDRGCWIHKIGTNNPNGVFMVECGFEGSNRPLSIMDGARRVTLNTVMLGTVGRTEAGRSLHVDLASRDVVGEISLTNVSSFMSSAETFYFKNVRHLTMSGCKAYGAVQFDHGFEQAALHLIDCVGVSIKDTHIEASAGNPNAVCARVNNVKAFSIEDAFMTGQTNTSNVLFVDASQHGRINRLYRDASFPAGAPNVYNSTNVTITDDIAY
jgi:hypothetical protein